MNASPTTSPTTATTTPASPATDVDVAVALYAAMAVHDIETAASLLDPAVALHVPGSHPLAGVHHGLDGVLAWAIGSTEVTDDGAHTEVVDVFSGPTGVAVLCRVTATRGERVLDNTTIHLLRLRDGKVTEIRFHNFDGLAVDAFWS